MPLTALPNLGDRILVRSEYLNACRNRRGYRPAVIISMAECHRLAPHLWKDTSGRVWPEEDKPYAEDDTIRAYKFEDAKDEASFCIMRFGNGTTNPHEFNSNVEPAPTLKPCACGYDRPRVRQEEAGIGEHAIQCPACHRATLFFPSIDTAARAWNG